MQKKYSTGLMWFRRDLRAFDNAALYHALKTCDKVHCVFVFDKEILDCLPKQDRRVEFIWESVRELNEQLQGMAAKKGGLITLHAAASDAGVFNASAFQQFAPTPGRFRMRDIDGLGVQSQGA